MGTRMQTAKLLIRNFVDASLLHQHTLVPASVSLASSRIQAAKSAALLSRLFNSMCSSREQPVFILPQHCGATRERSTSVTDEGPHSAARTYLVHRGNYVLSTAPGSSGHSLPSLEGAARKLQRGSPEANLGQPTMTGRQLLMDGDAATSTATSASAQPTLGQPTMSGRQLLMDGDAATSTATSASGPEYDQDDAGDDSSTDIKQRILDDALKHVKAKGWSVESLQLAAQENGLSPAAVGMFTRPEAELVQYFVDKCNEELAEKLEASKAELQGLRVPERIRTALQWRLEMLIPYMDSWPQALAIHSTPGSLPTAVRQVGKLVDDIWYAAGDTSTDYNWYTKRALLAAVYSATELYMLTDYSPGYADTWQALDRRLQDVARLGKATGQVKGMVSQAAENLGSVAQWAQEQFLRNLHSQGPRP